MSDVYKQNWKTDLLKRDSWPQEPDCSFHVLFLLQRCFVFILASMHDTVFSLVVIMYHPSNSAPV